MISGFSIKSLGRVAYAGSSFADASGSPSLTFSGEASVRVSLSVEKRNIDQKYNPNIPVSAAQTIIELCEV